MNRKRTLLFSLILLANITFLAGQKYAPVNPDATKEARQLLDFLYQMKEEGYTLSGQHNFTSDLNRYEEAVRKVTGKTPVIWGADFSFNAQGDSVKNYQHCGPMNLTVPFDSCRFNGRSTDDLRSNMIAEAIRQYQKGRIITLMWHACFPWDGDDCDGATIWSGDNRVPDEAWEELLTPGTDLNRKWQQQADRIVVYLKQLQALHIPVLWRPYHEMNGGWFWWGGRPGEQGYPKLWRMMYDYFVNHHKLDNLLWVWNANAVGQWVPAYQDFYPGAEYVDILATDVYRREYTWETYNELKRLGQGKVVSLGEIGEVPKVDQYNEQPYTWFMCWGYYIDQYNDPGDVKAIYNHPRTITLDKLDYKDGKYKLK